MENEDRIEETDLQHIIDGVELADDEDDPMPEGLDEDQIEGIVRTAVMDAVDFIEMEISPDREKAQRYADGKVDIGNEEGRSKLVATKVRDTIRAVKPSLMRVFLTSSKFVEYIPQGPEDVQVAEDATEAMHVQFNQIGGFSILRDAFHDALVKKTGIVKAYYDDYEAPKVYNFTGLSQDQMMALALDPEVEVVEMAQAFGTSNIGRLVSALPLAPFIKERLGAMRIGPALRGVPTANTQTQQMIGAGIGGGAATSDVINDPVTQQIGRTTGIQLP